MHHETTISPGFGVRVIVVLSVALGVMPACATIAMQTRSERGARVFTGTRQHFDMMAHPYRDGTWWNRVDKESLATLNYWVPVGLVSVFWMPLDFPLSLVADTVILPYTVPAQLVWGNYELSKPTARLLIAGATNDLGLVRKLLDDNPELIQQSHRFPLHYRSRGELSLLSIAAATGNPGFVALLLEHGAAVNTADHSGRTPLYNACDPGSIAWSLSLYADEMEALQKRADFLEVARLLLESGAELAAAGEDGHTPLTGAARAGNVEVAELLIDRGADVNARSGRLTPLMAAVRGRHLEVARLLISHGADVNPLRKGETPLEASLRLDEPELAELLRAHGGHE